MTNPNLTTSTREKTADGAARRAVFLERVVLAAVVVVVSLLRARFLSVPLERDEGDYALGGWLLLHGKHLYADLYTMRWPGVYLAHAALMSVFGPTAQGIHAGLLIVHGLTTALVYLVGRRFFGATSGVCAALLYGVSATAVVFLGFTANSEHFINLYAVGALALLSNNGTRGSTPRRIAAGALMGLAFVTKQHAAALACVGLLCVVALDPQDWKHRARAGAWYLAGAALPIVVVLVTIAIWGVFPQFLRWTVEYARAYAGGMTFSNGMDLLQFQLRGMLPVVWPVGAVALVGLVAGMIHPVHRRATSVALVYLLAALGMISVGFYFREHYFLLACPPIAWLGGGGIHAITRRFDRWAPACAAVMVTVTSGNVLVAERAYFFSYTSEQISRERYRLNPFVESPGIADWISERTNPNDFILVLGSEPQIYLYADRPNATPHVHMYPLMEDQPFARAMQEELIQQAESAQPAYIVFVPVVTSWLQTASSDDLIFRWFAAYTRDHYALEAVVEVPLSGVGRVEPIEGEIPAIDPPPIEIWRRMGD